MLRTQDHASFRYLDMRVHYRGSARAVFVIVSVNGAVMDDKRSTSPWAMHALPWFGAVIDTRGKHTPPALV